MQLKQILNKYKIIEAQMLYNKAVDILSLISNEELEEIFTTYPELFSKITNIRLTEEELLRDEDAMRQAIDIFIQTIESRNLSQDEFEAMTLDDIKEYIYNIVNHKSPKLFKVIGEIEKNQNGSRN